MANGRIRSHCDRLNTARALLFRYMVGVEKQAIRSLRQPAPSPAKGGDELQYRLDSAAWLADQDAYAIQLCNLVRAARWPNVEDRVKAVRDALDEFSEAVPHWREIRNAIEHADEYADGAGRHEEAVGRMPTPTYGRSIQILDWSLDLVSSRDAARQLYSRVQEAIEDAKRAGECSDVVTPFYMIEPWSALPLEISGS